MDKKTQLIFRIYTMTLQNLIVWDVAASPMTSNFGGFIISLTTTAPYTLTVGDQIVTQNQPALALLYTAVAGQNLATGRDVYETFGIEP